LECLKQVLLRSPVGGEVTISQRTLAGLVRGVGV
jgi:hypothetical protein